VATAVGTMGTVGEASGVGTAGGFVAVAVGASVTAEVGVGAVGGVGLAVCGVAPAQAASGVPTSARASAESKRLRYIIVIPPPD
jgi:hypothetical protein